MKKATSRDSTGSGKGKKPGRRASSAAKLPDMSAYGRLAEYNRKRHFDVTPEPQGTARARQAGRPLEFVVQKHRATALHYDFRLEHRGVMLSWAVPKGPSPDPAVKRLAMETEPHPMDYNQFEGVIPEGAYGGGTVMIWDKGVWAPIAGDRLGDESGRRSPAREGRPQVRAARGEASGLVGPGPDARRPAVAPHQAPGRVREHRGPHGHEAAVGRVRAHDDRDRPRRRREPAPAPASRGRRSRHAAPGPAVSREGRADHPTGDAVSFTAASRRGRGLTELSATSRRAGPATRRRRPPSSASDGAGSTTSRKAVARPRFGPPSLALPTDTDTVEIRAGERAVRLTNLRKVFWPELGLTKRDLLQYYADVAPALLPHLRDRAMVMKRYPNGAAQPFFFMKRVPEPHPPWLELCPIEHSSGSVIDFPVVQDLLSLLWVVNLGCIDLNQWYARCDDVDRPDYVHFDLDPVTGATAVPFDRLREAALTVRDALAGLDMPAYVKTTGSRGFHVYVPIVRGPTQKDVWDFAKRVALALAAARPTLLTAEYRIPKRPAGRVLVDYNQNAWGRTLASIYSVRPHPRALVSTPVTWDEVARGVRLEDLHIGNVPARVRQRGDLWAPMLAGKKRVRLPPVS